MPKAKHRHPYGPHPPNQTRQSASTAQGMVVGHAVSHSLWQDWVEGHHFSPVVASQLLRLLPSSSLVALGDVNVELSVVIVSSSPVELNDVAVSSSSSVVVVLDMPVLVELSSSVALPMSISMSLSIVELDTMTSVPLDADISVSSSVVLPPISVVLPPMSPPMSSPMSAAIMVGTPLGSDDGVSLTSVVSSVIPVGSAEGA
mmetsp:Transcript_27084/g.59235  ORF Transcript_27084/g.59235 Transcript_27084/m.59235 type:complete len:202 (+) Transcript_27084:724-1329(+)